MKEVSKVQLVKLYDRNDNEILLNMSRARPTPPPEVSKSRKGTKKKSSANQRGFLHCLLGFIAQGALLVSPHKERKEKC
jgi:hypothetical protein